MFVCSLFLWLISDNCSKIRRHCCDSGAQRNGLSLKAFRFVCIEFDGSLEGTGSLIRCPNGDTQGIRYNRNHFDCTDNGLSFGWIV